MHMHISCSISKPRILKFTHRPVLRSNPPTHCTLIQLPTTTLIHYQHSNDHAVHVYIYISTHASIIVLLSSTLDYVACMMLDPCNYFLGHIAARAARPTVYAHVHILDDHVTLSIG